MSIFFAMMYPDTVAGAPTIISIATISLGPKPIPMAAGRNMTGRITSFMTVATSDGLSLVNACCESNPAPMAMSAIGVAVCAI